ncbi:MULTISPECIES: ribosome small subunit-dependent GTPase A [Acidiphilium]|uniref:Small ribosomal subunit biogenesis GTPase RsgA n=1 Tax=Acidiphilium rubrum TaxID=526 RepID=A0A8G2FE58_ACIRU|nr:MULTISPECIES: ribosome small subunit-dependent GTPase A [Acidiphilium]SIR14059.1 ribosome biogenesis GTPase [Acidiphilium rubrum]
MTDLDHLGWSETLAQSFADIAEPTHIAGRIIAHHRGHYELAYAGGTIRAQCAGRMRHRDTDLGLPVVGDFVVARLEGGGATIDAVLPRRTKFARAVGDLTRHDVAKGEQIIAANIDYVFIVTGADADFSTRRLERLLGAAYGSGAVPMIVLTKIDLGLAPPMIDQLAIEAPGVAVHLVSNATGEGIAALRALIRPGETALLVGSSGVGKSSLVNRLLGTDRQATSITDENGRGRHTTTSRDLFALDGGGLILDTPGIRAITQWQTEGLDDAFADITTIATHCRFSDCRHEAEPGCAVQAAIADGTLEAHRLTDYAKLDREMAHLARRGDKRAEAAQRRKWAKTTRQRRTGDVAP